MVSMMHETVPGVFLSRFRWLLGYGPLCLFLCLQAFPQHVLAGDGFYDIRFSAREITRGDTGAEGVEFSLDRSGAFSFSLGKVTGLPVFQRGLLLKGVLQTLEAADGGTEAAGQAVYHGFASEWRLNMGDRQTSLCLQADARLLQNLPEP